MILIKFIQNRSVMVTGIFLGVGIMVASRRNISNEPHQSQSLHNIGKAAFPSYIFGNNLTLVSSEYVTHDTKEFKFSLPGNIKFTGINAGEAVLAAITNKQTKKTFYRPYSPIYDPTEPEVLKLVIKRMNDFGSSASFHDLNIGDTVKFRGPLPINKVDLENIPNKVGMIAGGSGITPIYSMINYLLLHKPGTKISLVYANKSENDILLRQKLETLKASYPERFSVVYVLGNAEKDNGENIYQGRIEKSILSKHISPDSAVYLCGPQGMVDYIKGTKKNKGILDNNHVHVF